MAIIRDDKGNIYNIPASVLKQYEVKVVKAPRDTQPANLCLQPIDSPSGPHDGWSYRESFALPKAVAGVAARAAVLKATAAKKKVAAKAKALAAKKKAAAKKLTVAAKKKAVAAKKKAVAATKKVAAARKKTATAKRKIAAKKTPAKKSAKKAVKARR